MSNTAAASSNNIASAFIAELQHEAETTRKCLERIPAEKFDWKPHEKSMTFGALASHIAEMFGWTPAALTQTELDFAKMDYTPFQPATTEDLVEFLDKNVAEAIDTLRNTPDEVFMEQWSMRNGETVYFTMPKIAVMRSVVTNHIIHHRGQLSVYLRLNDIAVPQIYGPSADEGQM
ncbi:DinB family protein [Leptolyngbya sp. 7M]|uniref:DinB family protein n=1 Tax=Leptolyngbya sp. 7M TaxID=2812896 RepID=UPI001B8A9D06|nr:DinB family protein [Leptolyngbya sp. 7M]QYO65427.1 DinB family protein [Leptolyngbya sp. 7M]